MLSLFSNGFSPFARRPGRPVLTLDYDSGSALERMGIGSIAPNRSL